MVHSRKYIHARFKRIAELMGWDIAPAWGRDYEGAARRAGWSKEHPTIPNPEGYILHADRYHPAGNVVAYVTWEECCKEEGIEVRNKSRVGATMLDYNSVYGGYCITRICNEAGGQSHVTPWPTRYTPKEFDALLSGIEIAKGRA